MALDGRPVWLSADPLAAPVRITTDIPYGGMPVRFVTPGGLHEAQAVRMDAGWQSAPIWEVEDSEGGGGETPEPVDPTLHLVVSRASTGYAQTVAGTLTSFAANTLRKTDKGLLVEESRSNAQKYSQDFANAYWTKGALSLAVGATAPDGTATATTITDDATMTYHRIYNGFDTVVVANINIVSVYAKKGTGSLDWLQVHGNVWANFNLTTGAIGFMSGSNVVARCEALGNGWWRCIVGQWAGLASGGFGVQLFPLPSDVNDSVYQYSGSGSSVIVWGVQVESWNAGGAPAAGDVYATSYIPTTTVAVTRAADAVTFIGNSDTLLDGSGATIVASMDGIPKLIQADLVHGSSGSMTLYKSAPTVLDLASGTGAAQKTGLASHTIAAKYGAAWTAAGGKSLAGKGVAAVTATGAVAPLGTVYVGSNGTVNHVNSYVRSLKLWNTRISDADLALETGVGSAVPPTIDLDLTAAPAADPPPWALVGSWTYSTPVATVPFTGLAAYSEIRVLLRNVTLSLAGVAGVQVSTDNGATWFTASGDYRMSNGNGVEANNTAIPFNTATTAAARSGRSSSRCSISLPCISLNSGTSSARRNIGSGLSQPQAR